MAYQFDKEKHDAFMAMMDAKYGGWLPHPETCVCKSSLPAVKRELAKQPQKLDFAPQEFQTPEEEVKSLFKSINEI
jgi:hypothetical protein